MRIIILSFIPLVGTAIGAFLGSCKKLIRHLAEKEHFLMAVATGILMCITVELGFEALANIRTSIKFLLGGATLGFLFIVLMDYLSHHIGGANLLKIFWAMTVHNIPEGLLVGMSLTNKKLVPLPLILGITLQNIPDGFVVTLPLAHKKGRKKAFLYGVISGAIEPIASLAVVFFVSKLHGNTVLEPIFIGFSFVSLILISRELFVECQKRKVAFATAILSICINLVF